MYATNDDWRGYAYTSTTTFNVDNGPVEVSALNINVTQLLIVATTLRALLLSAYAMQFAGVCVRGFDYYTYAILDLANSTSGALLLMSAVASGVPPDTLGIISIILLRYVSSLKWSQYEDVIRSGSSLYNARATLVVASLFEVVALSVPVAVWGTLFGGASNGMIIAGEVLYVLWGAVTVAVNAYLEIALECSNGGQAIVSKNPSSPQKVPKELTGKEDSVESDVTQSKYINVESEYYWKPVRNWGIAKVLVGAIFSFTLTVSAMGDVASVGDNDRTYRNSGDAVTIGMETTTDPSKARRLGATSRPRGLDNSSVLSAKQFNVSRVLAGLEGYNTVVGGSLCLQTWASDLYSILGDIPMYIAIKGERDNCEDLGATLDAFLTSVSTDQDLCNLMRSHCLLASGDYSADSWMAALFGSVAGAPTPHDGTCALCTGRANRLPEYNIRIGGTHSRLETLMDGTTYFQQARSYYKPDPVVDEGARIPWSVTFNPKPEGSKLMDAFNVYSPECVGYGSLPKGVDDGKWICEGYVERVKLLVYEKLASIGVTRGGLAARARSFGLGQYQGSLTHRNSSRRMQVPLLNEYDTCDCARVTGSCLGTTDPASSAQRLAMMVTGNWPACIDGTCWWPGPNQAGSRVGCIGNDCSRCLLVGGSSATVDQNTPVATLEVDKYLTWEQDTGIFSASTAIPGGPVLYMNSVEEPTPTGSASGSSSMTSTGTKTVTSTPTPSVTATRSPAVGWTQSSRVLERYVRGLLSHHSRAFERRLQVATEVDAEIVDEAVTAIALDLLSGGKALVVTRPLSRLLSIFIESELTMSLVPNW